MHFQIGDVVRTIDDGKIGKIVGVFDTKEYITIQHPQTRKNVMSGWYGIFSNKFKIDYVYYIRFEGGMRNLSIEQYIKANNLENTDEKFANQLYNHDVQTVYTTALPACAIERVNP